MQRLDSSGRRGRFRPSFGTGADDRGRLCDPIQVFEVRRIGGLVKPGWIGMTPGHARVAYDGHSRRVRAHQRMALKGKAQGCNRDGTSRMP